MREVRGQYSLEYLIVIGIAFIITIPLIAVFYAHQTSLKEEVVSSQTSKIASQLVKEADSLYYIGYPSKKTLRLYFPSNIKYTEIKNNYIKFIIDKSSGDSEIVEYSVANLTGAIETFEGTHVIVIETMPDSSVKITER